MVESSFYRYRCLGSRESRVLDARFRFLGLVLSVVYAQHFGSSLVQAWWWFWGMSWPFRGFG